MLNSFVVAMLAAASGGALAPQEIFARASAGVGYVVAGEQLGSVVAVSPNRVVTNWHVIAPTNGISQPSVHLGELQSPAVLVGVDVDRDIAVLQLLSGSIKTVPERRSNLPAVGERAFTIGSPNGLANTFAEGLISNTQKLKDVTLLQTTAAISKGSSGGGLFDDRARLIGITTLFMSQGQQLNFAVPTSAVEDALAALFASAEVASAIVALPAQLRLTLQNSVSRGEGFLLARLLNPSPRDGEGVSAPQEPSAVDSRVRTPSAKWSSAGWMAFRWGMGPGDVEARLTAAEGPFHATDFTCITTTRASEIVCDVFAHQNAFRWENQPASMSFWFFESELLSVQVAVTTDKSTASSLLKRVEKSLAKAHGKPNERRAPAESDEAMIPTVVEWRAATLEVALTLSPPKGTLRKFWEVSATYSDPLRERKSLGLTEPLEALPPKEVAKKTPAKTWANVGWNEFKWGMGPGDVSAILTNPSGSFRSSAFTCERSNIRENAVSCDAYEDQHGFRIFGAAPSLHFTFFEGELFSAFLLFFSGIEQGQAMFEEIGRSLMKKYGKPTGHDVPDLHSQQMVIARVEWEMPALVIKLELQQPPVERHAKGSSIWLTYSDPERGARFQRAPSGKKSTSSTPTPSPLDPF